MIIYFLYQAMVLAQKLLLLYLLPGLLNRFSSSAISTLGTHFIISVHIPWTTIAVLCTHIGKATSFYFMIPIYVRPFTAGLSNKLRIIILSLWTKRWEAGCVDRIPITRKSTIPAVVDLISQQPIWKIPSAKSKVHVYTRLPYLYILYTLL